MKSLVLRRSTPLRSFASWAERPGRAVSSFSQPGSSARSISSAATLASLARAVAGASGAYLLAPPIPQEDDPEARYVAIARAVREGVVVARNGLKVLPDHDLATVPAADVLVVPGGPGARPASRSEPIRAWLKDRVAGGATVLSVCTGALVMGRAGLLDGIRVTTHHGALDELREAAPEAIVDPSLRYHKRERMVVAAGVASGIDGALELVSRQCGVEIAQSTADYMEYPWQRA